MCIEHVYMLLIYGLVQKSEELKMGYWKSKVLPKIKKVFEKNPAKKAAVAEACKSFDDSKVS